MTAEPAVAVCIVSWNTRDLLRECLQALQHVRGVDEVIVVDNDSRDGTEAMILERFPEVRLVQSGANLGFGRACNLAAKKTSASNLVFLNPDTIPEPGFVEALLEVAERVPAAGLYGGRTTKPDGTLDPRSCWGLPSLWSAVCFATGLSALFPHHPLFNPEALGGWARDSEREVGYVTGCLLLVPRSWWDRLGGFDEVYWLYGEDADLGARARALGARPRITPRAQIMHVVGAASDSRAAKMVPLYQGKVTYFRRNKGHLQGELCRRMLLAGVALRAAAFTIAGRSASTEGVAYRTLWARRAEWRLGFAPGFQP